MKNSSKHTSIVLPVIILFSVLLLSSLPVRAQDSDQAVTFATPRIELLFKPPLRSGFNSPYPLQIEVPRLNLVVNVLENYIQYLSKLQKIATGTTLKLFYAPDLPLDTYDDDSKLIRIRELGLNQILQQVNQHLKDKEGTESNYLLDNADSLFTIPDQLPRQTSKIAMRTELVNHSFFQKSLEPDTDFCVIDKNRVATARPFKRSNRIFLFTDQNDICSATLLLNQSKSWYANLKASPSSEFIAFTDGLVPMVMNMSASEPKRIFADEGMMLLEYQWSPKEPVLAGLALNNSDQQRILFIHDALKGEDIKLANAESLETNYYHAHLQWSPDGRRIILTSAKAVHIIDMTEKKIYPNVIRLPNEIGELVWSDDSQSFALVEIIGQARNRYAFDDLDYRKSILHRYNIKNDFSVVEDHAQRSESRNTIKLVSFWTMDRVLYLEGRLVSKRLNTPFWDLSKTFAAYVTPGPTTTAGREGKEVLNQSSRELLPLQYLFVFRNLDGKYKNIYDAGFSHSNHIFTDNFTNIWFIGLKKPDELAKQRNIYSHRATPYPFAENNLSLLSEIPAAKMETLLKFMQDYNLRVMRFNHDLTRFFMLANFSGPLNLWSGDLQKLVDGLNQRDE